VWVGPVLLEAPQGESLAKGLALACGQPLLDLTSTLVRIPSLCAVVGRGARHHCRCRRRRSASRFQHDRFARSHCASGERAIGRCQVPCTGGSSGRRGPRVSNRAPADLSAYCGHARRRAGGVCRPGDVTVDPQPQVQMQHGQPVFFVRSTWVSATETGRSTCFSPRWMDAGSGSTLEAPANPPQLHRTFTWDPHGPGPRSPTAWTDPSGLESTRFRGHREDAS
jgi:hypothetical protein